tara:strand:+ start:50251 stop:50991 length:741 start_codon:yes stop_codon:yes gene_type:complete
MKFLQLIASVILFSFILSTQAATFAKMSAASLGPLQLSVEKFDNKDALEKHHEHLLAMAMDPNNTVMVRYTYALLLGINHADDDTRIMAIEALAKLAQDKSLKAQAKAYIQYMRNLIIYQLQNHTFEKNTHPKSINIKNLTLLKTALVNQYGTHMQITNINQQSGEFKATLITRQNKVIPTIGFVHNNVISFTTNTVSYLGYIHHHKLKTWWLSSIGVNRKGGDQVYMGDSTFVPFEAPKDNKKHS